MIWMDYPQYLPIPNKKYLITYKEGCHRRFKTGAFENAWNAFINEDNLVIDADVKFTELPVFEFEDDK